MNKIHHALKPGGMFISREPLAYAQWLKKLRNLMPIGKDEDDPNEKPLGDAEFMIIKKVFPDLCLHHYRILARVDRLTNNLKIIRTFARADNLLFALPGSKALAGDVVMWARK